MKGILKGFKYIGRMFEDEKEPEIQIGAPTDVKHVAHIGWEGPSATTPSWMNDFKSADSELNVDTTKKPPSSGEKQKNKARRKASTETTNSPAESPTRVGVSTRSTKRSTGKQRGHSAGSGTSETGLGLDLTKQNDRVPKNPRPKKSKGSTGGGGGEPPPPLSQEDGLEKSKETDISMRTGYLV